MLYKQIFHMIIWTEYRSCSYDYCLNFYDEPVKKVELLCCGTSLCGCGGLSQQQDLAEEEEEEGFHVVLFFLRENTKQSSYSPLKPLLSKLLRLFFLESYVFSLSFKVTSDQVSMDTLCERNCVVWFCLWKWVCVIVRLHHLYWIINKREGPCDVTRLLLNL